jgi:hypothetical protein
MENAFSTAVCVPPFLNRLPFPEEITTGFEADRMITAGAPAITSAGSVSDNPAAAPVATNFRRLTFPVMIFDFLGFRR